MRDLPADTIHMQEALQLAARSIGLSEPNPRVGCVLVAPGGAEIGSGYTQQAGGPHAEVMALRDARARGHATQVATAYVTLEPCSHHGRTGPCCDALIEAGVARVVAAVQDPNPLVGGQGFARLRAAGVTVESGPGMGVARELNIGFFNRMLRRRPWTRMKIAASLDGRTALDNGQSQWITSAPARADGHVWRARAGAVLSGIGTVLDDNPRLDVREVDVRQQPALVVVDSHLQLPLDAALFTVTRPLFVYAADADETRATALRERGATIVLLPGPARAGGPPKVDLDRMMDDLGQRGINELHIEAGAKLNGSLLRAGLVDELLIYLAPKLIGPGRPMAALDALTELAQALPLRFLSATPVGEELRIVARVTAEPWS